MKSNVDECKTFQIELGLISFFNCQRNFDVTKATSQNIFEKNSDEYP